MDGFVDEWATRVNPADLHQREGVRHIITKRALEIRVERENELREFAAESQKKLQDELEAAEREIYERLRLKFGTS